jgi:hypothetical protein
MSYARLSRRTFSAVAADTNMRTSIKEQEYLLLFLLSRWRFVFALGNRDLSSVTPSPTLNKASTVAKLPQLTQYFIFPL